MKNSAGYRWAALTLIAGATIVRLVYLGWHCPLDLAPDEAHYWDWSRRLDWSYYSKGPLVAWLIRLSCELFGPLTRALTGTETLAVRLPAVLCGSLLLAGLYVLTERIFRRAQLACAVVALALTLPILAAGSSLITIDAPFTCCWMWGLVFVHRALWQNIPTRSASEGQPHPSLALRVGMHSPFHDSARSWWAAGACLLLGVLAKPTMLLWLPSITLFLLMTPVLRGELCKKGFWIMTGMGAVGCVPILVWNVRNGWVMFKHTQGHAGFTDDSEISWLGPFCYVGSQFAILLGFWFVAWARAMWDHRPTRETRVELCFLWWMSAPTIVFFGLFSFINGGGSANWPLAGYLSGMVLTADWLARTWQDPRAWYRQTSKACTGLFAALGLFILVVMHQPIELQAVLLQVAGPATSHQPAPLRRVDPTARLRGWRYLATEVDRIRDALQARGIDPVLATERWTQAGEIGFYCREQPSVYCLGILVGDRHNQYDLWRPNPAADPAAFLGRTFILIGTDTDPLRRFFAAAEPTRTISYRENDHLIDEWTITIAHDFRGGAMPAKQNPY